jgi:hypothetical protein
MVGWDVSAQRDFALALFSLAYGKDAPFHKFDSKSCTLCHMKLWTFLSFALAVAYTGRGAHRPAPAFFNPVPAAAPCGQGESGNFYALIL